MYDSCPILAHCYRSVRLRNGFNEHDSGLSVLLVHVSRMSPAKSDSYLKKIVENYMERTKRKGKSSTCIQFN